MVLIVVAVSGWPYEPRPTGLRVATKAAMAVEGDWKIQTICKVYTILWRCHTGEIGDK